MNCKVLACAMGGCLLFIVMRWSERCPFYELKAWVPNLISDI